MGTDNTALVREGFGAYLTGDFDTLRELLAPDAQWLWWEPTAADCHGREKILATLRARRSEGVITGLDGIAEGGEKVLVELTGPNGAACMVVTVRDGRIVRMQDHPSRADALADAGLAPRPAAPEPTRPEHTEPGWDRVSGLIPFVHVRDLMASVAFYEQLGFRVTARFPAGTPEPSWVALDAGHARLMLEHADQPIQARAQGVLFYLYARDLWALRDRLVAAGIDAGEIRDGRPGPDAEMRLADPDGYVLMVAQIEADEAPAS